MGLLEACCTKTGRSQLKKGLGQVDTREAVRGTMKEGRQFGVAAPACHLRAPEAEAGGAVGLRSVWAPERNPLLKANTKEEHKKREELGKWRLESVSPSTEGQ